MAILLSVSGSWGEKLDESRKTLEDIQRRIEETSRQLEKKQVEKGKLAEDLKTVDRELDKLTQRVSTLNRQIDSLAQDARKQEALVGQARRDIAGIEARVRQRLVVLYKRGEGGGMRMLLAGESPQRLAEDYIYWGRIVRRDRELMAEYRQQLGKLQASLQQLEQLRRQQQAALDERTAEQQTLQKASRLKADLLARVRKDEASLSGQLGELRERAKRLGSLIKKLESDRPREYSEKSGVFGALKGRLPWPVKGPVKVGFGTGRHPELGTMFESNGIEIATAVDQPIAAVAAGRVAFANWFKGYGNLLIVDHGDSFFTLYAHASRLNKKVGDRVAAGETVGASGFEGSRTVYFEIRKGGAPQDPQAWLVKR
ncbi:peptidase M23 [Desulfuromonas versatilis]|uniref:Peptidase M23 n=1 Tax=Desulfuromonas versatilis TaxID=2802975 RepID=A0ABM8HXC3_9BACT|nr:peptidoglycan DD-metalloendopeptidase family protein [Desulfuromonas versatilis]BCR05759.1 peptidase M23 [Desulfuromonas versatilis]